MLRKRRTKKFAPVMRGYYATRGGIGRFGPFTKGKKSKKEAKEDRA